MILKVDMSKNLQDKPPGYKPCSWVWRHYTGRIPPSSEDFSLFVLRPSSTWNMPTHFMEDNLFHSICWFKCSTQLKIFSQKHLDWPTIRVPWPSQVDTKINHHIVHSALLYAIHNKLHCSVDTLERNLVINWIAFINANKTDTFNKPSDKAF